MATALHTTKRSKPMRVLCLGMCRTGTKSLLQALERLGYQTFHMRDVHPRPELIKEWKSFVERTFLQPELQYKPTREDFDRLVGPDTDAITDVPCAIFAEHLIRAYPEAKVVLTPRPVDSWMRSMDQTVWPIIRWPSYRLLKHLDPEFMGPWVGLLENIIKVHSNGAVTIGEEARQAYLAHNDWIRKLAPPDRFLEFTMPYDWNPLCEFLGQPVPKEKYPNGNETQMFVARLYIWRNQSIQLVLKRWAWPIILVLTVLMVTRAFL